MEIFHSYYKFWRNFKEKSEFCWVAITKTYPSDYIGNVYRKLAPIGENFDKVEHPFDEKLFFKEYVKLLRSLNRHEVIEDLKSFSKGKDVIMLNWEDLTRHSEGRFAYAWLFHLDMKTADSYDLEAVLKRRKLTEDLTGFNFLNI